MIAIYGDVRPTDKKLISELKKYFESDEVILNWDGKSEADPCKTTLAITNKMPPFKIACSTINIDAARRLIKS